MCLYERVCGVGNTAGGLDGTTEQQGSWAVCAGSDIYGYIWGPPSHSYSEEWPTVKCLLAGMLPRWRPTKPHLKDINQHCQHLICGRKDFNQKNNSDHFDNQQRADLDIA